MAFAVFEPFVKNLIPANLKFPHGFWYACKVLGLVDVYPPLSLTAGGGVFGPTTPIGDFVVSGLGVGGDVLVNGRRLQQPQSGYHG